MKQFLVTVDSDTATRFEVWRALKCIDVAFAPPVTVEQIEAKLPGATQQFLEPVHDAEGAFTVA